MRATRISETQRSWNNANLLKALYFKRKKTKLVDLRALAEEAVESRNCRRLVQEEFPQFTCLYLATKYEHFAKQ